MVVPTYRRQSWLRQLLISLESQETQKMSVTVIVGDNDPNRTAFEVVKAFEDTGKIAYLHIPERGLSFVRNALVKAALSRDPDFIAMVDDDQWVSQTWLSKLVSAALKYGAEFVAGPVIQITHERNESWLVRAGYFRRRLYATGTAVPEAGCGNLLVKASWFEMNSERWFAPEYNFSGGEDAELTRRAVREGSEIIWCGEAVAWEHIPVSRNSFRAAFTRQTRIASVDLALYRSAGMPSNWLVFSSPLRIIFGAGLFVVFFLTNPELSLLGFKSMCRGLGFLVGSVGKRVEQYK